MMTLKEFEEFVRNRPEPDTPGFYKLVIYQWHKHDFQGDGRYGAMSHKVKSFGDGGKEVVGFLWRFPFSVFNDEPDYEYHPTFEQAHTAMMKKVGEKDIYGFCIKRLGYGPLGNHDWYVSYRSYDAEGHEFDHSSCSSYHYEQPGIYGKFLGRFPEEIPFKAGDIVQIVTQLYGERQEYATLGVVVGIPDTVEKQWKSYCCCMENGDTERYFFEDSKYPGADEEEYFVMFGPYDYNMQNFCFRMPIGVRPPAYPVPKEVREALMGYYQEYQKYIED